MARYWLTEHVFAPQGPRLLSMPEIQSIGTAMILRLGPACWYFRALKLWIGLHVTLNDSKTWPLPPRRLTWINHRLYIRAALFLRDLKNDLACWCCYTNCLGDNLGPCHELHLRRPNISFRESISSHLGLNEYRLLEPVTHFSLSGEAFGKDLFEKFLIVGTSRTV